VYQLRGGGHFYSSTMYEIEETPNIDSRMHEGIWAQYRLETCRDNSALHADRDQNSNLQLCLHHAIKELLHQGTPTFRPPRVVSWCGRFCPLRGGRALTEKALIGSRNILQSWWQQEKARMCLRNWGEGVCKSVLKRYTPPPPVLIGQFIEC